MKAIGFLKIHDEFSLCSKRIEDVISDNINNPLFVNKVVNYLNGGILVMKAMDIVRDSNGNTIGQYKIYSDGEWVWPSYYSYYLVRYPQLKIPDDFISHFNNKGDMPILDFDTNYRLYIEYLVLCKILVYKFPQDFKIPVEVQEIIKNKGLNIKCY